MPTYKYSAVAMDGTKRHGKADAADIAQLTGLLSGEGLFLIRHAPDERRQVMSRLQVRETADFCRQLSAMLSAGVSLIRAMMIISQRDAKPQVSRVYDAVTKELQRGQSLSEAMATQGKAFPPLLINMMRAGENSGRMDATAHKMAVYYEKQYKLHGKIRSAATYPLILAALILIVVLVIFTFVLPQFFTLFEGMTLPLPTLMVIAVSDFLSNNFLYLAIGVLLTIAFLAALFRSPGPGRLLDRWKLEAPVVGKLLRTIYTARFARTMASLYISGIPMIQSLKIARATIGNRYIESQFDMVIGDLANGRALSQALSRLKGFDVKLYSTILIGEESGRLEQMLDSVADQFDYEAETATQRLVALMEPALIVAMAAVVAFVILSVMLPIFQMYQGMDGQDPGV